MLTGQRILILSPHPDDEVVGAAAAIGRAKARGAAVFLLHLTTGIPARAALWPWERRGHHRRVARRQAEATMVAAALGAELAGFHHRPSRTLKDDLPAARRDIAATMARLRIDRLWVPAYEGGHSDHDAANGLASTLAALAPVWEFAEYNHFGGRTNANAFFGQHGPDCDLILTPDEIEQKSRLLRLYASERGNLGYTGVARECFRPLAAHDYSRPPHQGTLFYQRFHWVPFRHPRIDFTAAAAVGAAIRALRAEHGR